MFKAFSAGSRGVRLRSVLTVSDKSASAVELSADVRGQVAPWDEFRDVDVCAWLSSCRPVSFGEMCAAFSEAIAEEVE